MIHANPSILLGAAILVGLLSGHAAAQIVPPECSCTLGSNPQDFPQSDPLVGTYSFSTNTCSVIHPTPGTSACQVIGTITFYYNPVGFTWNGGAWGQPATAIPAAPLPNSNNFYSVNATHSCGAGNPSAYIYVWGDIGGSSHFFAASRVWNCTTSS